MTSHKNNLKKETNKNAFINAFLSFIIPSISFRWPPLNYHWSMEKCVHGTQVDLIFSFVVVLRLFRKSSEKLQCEMRTNKIMKWERREKEIEYGIKFKYKLCVLNEVILMEKLSKKANWKKETTRQHSPWFNVRIDLRHNLLENVAKFSSFFSRTICSSFSCSEINFGYCVRITL